MKILRLTAENVKRLTAVEIDAHGRPVIVLAGENEAGKSSILDAIAYALGGKALQPARPIREGEDRAEITVDLGDYIVTRTFLASGGGTLVVKNRDGARYPSPQALLDKLVGALTFDPLAFAEMDERAQADTLRRLAQVDTEDLDADRQRVYDERTLLNRDLVRAQGALSQATSWPDAGHEFVKLSEVTEALAAADALAETAAGKKADAAAAKAATDRAIEKARATKDLVERARLKMAELERQAEEAADAVHAALVAQKVAADAADAAEAAVPDRASLRAKVTEAESFNARVRDNLAAQALAENVDGLKQETAARTARIAELEAAKSDRLAAARFPVPELGLDDAGVTWNGLPFAQASGAVRIRASVAIGLALNPKLKVLLVRNGNDLGANNLRLLAEMAAAADAQLWIERIAGGDGQPTILIEDGAIAATSDPSLSPQLEPSLTGAQQS